MGAFSTRMKSTAQRLLSTYGQAVTLSRDVLASYDVDTGEVPTTSTIVYTGFANSSTYSFLELLNTTVLDTDVKLYFYSATAPLVNDTIEWEGKEHRVLQVDITSAQGDDCLYELQLRAG